MTSSLETADTRRLRQEFLKHVRARPESVLKNARSEYAGTHMKTRGPPPIAEGNVFSGRPPSPALANEVEFVVRNSIPAVQPSNTRVEYIVSNGKPHSPSMHSSDCRPCHNGPTQPSPHAAKSFKSPLTRHATSSNQQLEASGVSIPGPENILSL